MLSEWRCSIGIVSFVGFLSINFFFEDIGEFEHVANYVLNSLVW